MIKSKKPLMSDIKAKDMELPILILSRSVPKFRVVSSKELESLNSEELKDNYIFYSSATHEEFRSKATRLFSSLNRNAEENKPFEFFLKESTTA